MRRNLPVVLCGLALTLPAQQPAAPKEPTPAQRAQRLARELELPDHRNTAATALLRLGAAAVPALLQQARHPDLGVAREALVVLAWLGHEGMSAVPRLTELAKGTDAHAQAAAWALARLPVHGTFLMPSMEECVVREVDGDGKEIASSKTQGQPWSAQRLAGGTLLVAEVNGAVREYDDQGKVAWEWQGQNAYTAERLIDGNTLIAEFGSKRVLEVDPKGDEVWKFEGVGSLYAARLPGGNTLISDYTGNRVIEVDRAGQIVWQLDDVPQSYSCRRLPSGCTLVVQQQQNIAITFDRAGKKLAELKLEDRPNSHVVLLPDGWITSGQNRATRLDKEGKAIWKFECKGWVGQVTPR